MKVRILAYMKYVDDLLDSAPEGTDWDSVIKEHLIQLGFFMHERLVHLIVLITFALMEIITLVLVITQFSIPVSLLFLLILVLLIPYVMHYYLLENSVQNMYKQYDRLMQKAGHKAFLLSEKRE